MEQVLTILRSLQMEFNTLQMKKTVVIGASPNPERYSNLAVNLLKEKGFEVVPLGIRAGKVAELDIVLDRPHLQGTDTVSIYLNPQSQKDWYDYIIGLHPKRIIFNPDTENPELEELARSKGIETENACTLVLLKTSAF
jgi:uncharacterized protein